MELEDLASELSAHEKRSQWRYDELSKQIAALPQPNPEITTMSDANNSDKVNIYTNGDNGSAAAATMAAAALAGGGRRDDGLGGSMAALLAMGLLGNNRFDRGRDDGCVPSQLNTVADGINHNINNLGVGVNHNINAALDALTAQLTQGFNGQQQLDVMSKLGSIEGAIPLTGAQVTQSVLTAAAGINDRISDGLLTAIQGQAAINQNVSTTGAGINANISGTREAVLTTAALGVAATKDAQYAISTAIKVDGDATRALITRQYEDTLNRELSEARNALVELRSASRLRDSEINITNTNTATATQLQVQAQQQQQLQFMAQLVSEVRNLANDVQIVRQSQSNINFGVQGASTQGQAATNNRVS